MPTYKTNWTPSEAINFGDWNRIESNIMELSDYLNGIQYTMPNLFDNKSSLSLNGVGGYVNCGNSSSYDMTTLTVELWMKSDYTQVPYANIIDKSHGTSGWAFEHNVLGEYLYFYMGGTAATFTVSLNDGKWHHIAATYDGTNIKLYLDGNLNATAPSAPPTMNAGNLFIGSWTGGFRFFGGSVDNVRIWNVARTQTEIMTSKGKYLTGNETGLVSYWTCDDATGTTLKATKGINGTLQTGAGWGTPCPNIEGTVKTDRTVKDVPFLAEINRIENNLGNIHAAFGMTPPTVLAKKSWAIGQGFSNEDVNRLENNTQVFRTYADLIVKSYRYSGMFTCGQQGGLY